MGKALTSVHGRKLGIGVKGNLTGGNDVDLTQPCVDASITVGDENANARAITIQLKDANGNDINPVTSTTTSATSGRSEIPSRRERVQR